MHRSVAKRNTAKRMDALLALPLARFRRALAALPSDELAALAARLAVQRVRNRWARGGFGLARHRSSHELGLLARRETALRHELDARMTAAPAPIHLVPRDAAGIEDRAA